MAVENVIVEIPILYKKGDIVAFSKGHGMGLTLGVITGYSVDLDAGRSVWYNIATTQNHTFDYMHGGDISEWEILCKIEDPKVIAGVKHFIDTDEILNVSDDSDKT